MKLVIAPFLVGTVASFTPSSFLNGGVSHRTASASSSLDMKYKVAVVGGGPSGACAPEIFAQEKSIDTVLFERKMDNAKPCGGAIPLCMIGEFNIPESTVDRKVGVFFCAGDATVEMGATVEPVETPFSLTRPPLLSPRCAK